MHYSRSLLPVLANNLIYQSVLAINLMYWPSRYRLMCIGRVTVQIFPCSKPFQRVFWGPSLTFPNLKNNKKTQEIPGLKLNQVEIIAIHHMMKGFQLFYAFFESFSPLFEHFKEYFFKNNFFFKEGQLNHLKIPSNL